MNVPTCEFSRSVELDASLAEVFAFHGNPHNVSRISPAWQSVQVLGGEAVPGTGAEFVIQIRLLGLVGFRWRGVWRVVERPNCLVDEALQSPFSFWRHRHEFEALPRGRTRMTDRVSYRFPGGWLGKLVGETFGRVQFALMFADRQRRTNRWFKEQQPGSIQVQP